MYETNFFFFQSLFLKLNWWWKLNHPPQRDITEILSPILSLKWSSSTPYHFLHLWDKTPEHEPPQLHRKETWGQPSSDPRDIQCNPSIKKCIAEKINNTWMIISQHDFCERSWTKGGKCEGMEPENIKWKVSHMYPWGGRGTTMTKRMISHKCLLHINLITLELSWMTGIWPGIIFYQSWETLYMVTRHELETTQSGWSQTISWIAFCLWNKTGFVYLGNFQSCSPFDFYFIQLSFNSFPLYIFCT